jgi:hypothetical protein
VSTRSDPTEDSPGTWLETTPRRPKLWSSAPGVARPGVASCALPTAAKIATDARRTLERYAATAATSVASAISRATSTMSRLALKTRS